MRASRVEKIALKGQVFVLALMLAALVSSAETINVRKDGAGDFDVIQDAVNASSPGDTIMIGPGRYEEREIVTTPGWSAPVYILVDRDNLTFIGEGSGQTVVGQQEPWNVDQPFTRGIEAGPDWGSSRLSVVGIRFENIAFAVGGHPAPHLVVEACQFYGNHYGVIAVGPANVEVSDCGFGDLPHSGNLLASTDNLSLSILDCNFHLSDEHPWSQSAVHIQGTQDAEVLRTFVGGGDHGLYSTGGGAVNVGGCVFWGQDVNGLIVSGTAVNIQNCRFAEQRCAVNITGYSSDVAIGDTVFDEVSRASICFEVFGNLVVNDCIIDHGPLYAVEQVFDCEKAEMDLPHADMRFNDWGTSEADSIEAWIHSCDYVIEYVPFVGQPVSIQSKSLSALKNLFR